VAVKIKDKKFRRRQIWEKRIRNIPINVQNIIKCIKYRTQNTMKCAI
jgi:hypothetical protein